MISHIIPWCPRVLCGKCHSEEVIIDRRRAICLKCGNVYDDNPFDFASLKESKVTIEYVEYVLGFCFSSTGKHVALILKNRPAWQAGKLNGIGGKVEKNEFPIDAMIREFREEAGAITIHDDWRYFAKLHGPHFSVFCYACFDDSVFKSVATITEEEVLCVSTSKLKSAVRGVHFGPVPNVPWLVGVCLDTDFERIFIDADYRG